MSSTEGTRAATNRGGRRELKTNAARTISRMTDNADCVLNFAEFLEEAKPEEIRLLAEILSEWRNWSGSLRRGNFLRGVAEAVLAGEPGRDLSSWPAERDKTHSTKAG